LEVFIGMILLSSCALYDFIIYSTKCRCGIRVSKYE
jgi:hypothetical protein